MCSLLFSVFLFFFLSIGIKCNVIKLNVMFPLSFIILSPLFFFYYSILSFQKNLLVFIFSIVFLVSILFIYI